MLAIFRLSCICILPAISSSFIPPISVNQNGATLLFPPSSRISHQLTFPNSVRNDKKRTIQMSLSSNDDGISSSPLDRPVLSLMDTAAILTFAAVGKASHTADGSIDVFAVLVTAFPFLVSWFLVSPLLGCFTPSATADLKQAVLTTGKGWIVAVPLGCVLRGLIKGYIPPLPFVIVTMIATLVILSIGRAAYTALAELYVEMF